MKTLYQYQKETVDKFSNQVAVLDASEMGTGKTFVASELDMIRREQGKGPTLIIAPLSGTMNTWRKHYKEQYPHLKGIVCDSKNRTKFVRGLARTDWYNYYIIHWDVLHRELGSLNGVRWNHIIADEAHRTKNRKAQTTRALKRLTTRYKSALSGTPVTNRPQDLWSILNWLYPSKWNGYWKFYERYCEYTIEYPSGYHKFKGVQNYEELQELIDPFFVRHLKRSPCCPHHPQGVTPWLPDKTYADPIWVDLTPKQHRSYDAMSKNMLAWVGDQLDKPLVAGVAIAKLVRLQQLALAHADIDEDWSVILTEPSSKLDALMELIKDNEGEQIVVFSQFSKIIKLLSARLKKSKIPSGIFTGDTPARDRERIVQKFQAGKLRVFAGTIKAGGVGLDLFSASTVVFLDRSWSPAENLQSEDRLWRIGQKNSVTVYDIMARDTVDLGRRQAIQAKWNWIQELLGDPREKQLNNQDLVDDATALARQIAGF
jgi:SNF2 family DNA or RNA helicase